MGEQKQAAGCKLTQHTMEGHRVLTLENDQIRVGIDLDHGAHLFEMTDKRTNIDVMYKDPKGLNYDVGGWYELFPNAGAGCSYNGTDIPGHGDVQHLPWTLRIDRETEEEILVHLRTESKVLPFVLEKNVVIRKGQPTLHIAEKITNLNDTAEPYLWGHHVTFGAPFIGPSCRIDLPDCRVFDQTDYHPDNSRLLAGGSGTLDRMPGKLGESVNNTYFAAEPFNEMLFIDELREHWYNVYNEKEELGFALAWDGVVFPYLWLWQEHHSEQDEPFNGQLYAMALEPQASNAPTLLNAVTKKQAPVLEAGQSAETWLTVVMHANPGRVKYVAQDGDVTFAG
jgi:galactose mutarotase-like enzyme